MLLFIYFNINKFIMNNITEFLNSLCKWDKARLANIYNAYIINCINDHINDVWYNEKTGYVYIVLENWVQIAEAFNWVEFLTTNWETGEEFFYTSYDEAFNSLI